VSQLVSWNRLHSTATDGLSIVERYEDQARVVVILSSEDGGLQGLRVPGSGENDGMKRNDCYPGYLPE
jgi:hypothetical protein